MRTHSNIKTHTSRQQVLGRNPTAEVCLNVYAHAWVWSGGDRPRQTTIQKTKSRNKTRPAAPTPWPRRSLHTCSRSRSPADTTCGFQHFLRTRPTGSLFPRDTRSTPCLSRGARRTRACTRRRKCTSTEGSTPSAILGDTYSPCPLHQSSSASCSWFPSGG
jgi:hypothetical protein